MSAEPQAYDDYEVHIDAPNEGDYVLLPPGDYPFRVLAWKRSQFDGSAKMSACKAVIITLEIDGGELGLVQVDNRMFMHQKCEGILAGFFLCIGLRKHGDPLITCWNDAIGATGMCRTGIRKGDGQYEGKEYNDVKRFLEPKENSAMADINKARAAQAAAKSAAAPAPVMDTEEIPF